MSDHSHPMVGWVCVWPFPKTTEEDNANRDRIHTESIETPMGLLQMAGLIRVETSPDIETAVVVEVGPLPLGDADAQLAVPYSKGDLVYYPSTKGLFINGFLFLQVQSILSWKEAPAEPDRT